MGETLEVELRKYRLRGERWNAFWAEDEADVGLGQERVEWVCYSCSPSAAEF